LTSITLSYQVFAFLLAHLCLILEPITQSLPSMLPIGPFIPSYFSESLQSGRELGISTSSPHPLPP